MKNLCLLLALIIGYTTSILAQTQLTNIDNQVPVSSLKANGIVFVNGEDYLLETNQYFLRVSTLKNDSIQLLYKISDLPFDEKVNTYQGELYTRSGFLTNGIFLYEIFKNKIRKRNILTSELVDIYNFPDNKNLFFRNAEIIGNFIHLQKTGENGFMTINTTTHEFTNLPFSVDKTYRIGNIYYTPKTSGGIEEYNAEDKTTKITYENESSQYFGSNSTLLGKKGLIFGGFEQTRFIGLDTNFILNCELDLPAVTEVNVHETDEYYVAFYNDLNRTTIKVIDKLDCSVQSSKVVDFNTNGQKVVIYDSPIIDNEYLLFKVEDYSDHPDSLYLFDKSDLSFSPIPIENLRTIYPHSLFRSGDELYFKGEDISTFLSRDKLYSINLKTKEFKTELADYEYYKPVSFSHSDTDNTFLIIDRFMLPEQMKVLRFHSDSIITEIKNSHITNNIGLTPSRYLAIDNDKLVFEFKDEIYVTDNSISNPDKTYKIGSAKDISELIIDNNELKGLLNNNDSTYYFTYNFDNDELTLEPLTEYIQLEDNSIVVSNYVFGDFSSSNKAYFDLNTKSIETISIAGNIDTFYRSHNSILFVSSCAQGYCLTLFKDGEFSSLQLTYTENHKVFSKKNGAFIIVKFMSNDQNQIDVINKDGSLGDQITVTGSLLLANQKGIVDGPLSALMFYNIATEDLEVIMHRDHKFQSFTVPYIYALWTNVSWYKAENSIIIRSEDVYDPGIYILTLDKEVKKLNLDEGNPENYSLLIATANNGIITFVISSYQYEVEVVKYNIETEELIREDVEYPHNLYSNSELNSIYRVSQSTYYVTFSSHFGNSEPYLLDTENLTLQALPDLNLINQLSNPHQFIESPSYLYFIARSPDDNSYQLFSKQKDEITALSELSNDKSILKITPNPSSNFISIESDADVLRIQNADGTIVKTLNNYSADQNIDISDLSNGVYFIEISNKNIKSTSRFIKI